MRCGIWGEAIVVEVSGVGRSFALIGLVVDLRKGKRVESVNPALSGQYYSISKFGFTAKHSL